MPSEIVPPPPAGRVYAERRRVGPADVTPAGRARLDEIARWLQELAYADIVNAGVADAGFWVVRRTRIVAERFPRFAERIELRTFCSALAPLLAERRTSISGEGGSAIEAVSLWVNLDPATRLPARLPERFLGPYTQSADGRRARSRLRHPRPPEDASASAWLFRSTDLDVAGHVNNAVYWEVVEELIDPDAAHLDAEIEYRAPAPAGEARLLRAGRCAWVTSPEGELQASIELNER